ncbi:dienelactone hydrolase family protein [uncultured Sphingomonas sp.]|uniref:dienelactone hydrolase family protein n=1 Tax=uncultured Sphingomonas sp. TaxID=158754 RepID=UPI0035CA70E3
MTDIREQAVRLYDDYTHEHRDRRRLLREMAAVAGSVAAAKGLIAGIGASPAAAAVIAADDKRLRTETRTIGTGAASLTGYLAQPRRSRSRRPMIMVIHENRGLNDHIRDVARRVALAGFTAFAPDYLAGAGGTPADQDRARTMIGQLDLGAAVATTVAVMNGALTAADGPRRIGAVGFCWGGAFVNRLAVAAGPALAAGVPYYGTAPNPAEAIKVQTPLMIQLAGKDARVNATALPWAEALKAAGKRVEAFTYPGVDHAFNNDTSAERYDKAAADLAWARSTAFLKRELDA